MGVHPKVIELLSQRGIVGHDQRDHFLSPNYERDIYDPYLFDDMRRAVARIVSAIKGSERITIYGDYDVDGVSAAVILFDVITKAGGDVTLFFNHREDDGYGLHAHCIERIAQSGSTLLITTDSGIAHAKEIQIARDLCIDTIITDHHTVPRNLPPAYAIIHPQVHADRYPWKYLSGGGCAFKLAQGLCRFSSENPTAFPGISPAMEKWLLDCVALATIADCVPLLGENRALVYYGLKVIARTRRPGLRALLSRVPPLYHDSMLAAIQFGVIPLLNAASRMDHAQRAADVLLAKNCEDAEKAADVLAGLNRERQRLTQKTIRSIPGSVLVNERVVLAASGQWRLGVLGLVAHKLVAVYRKPVILVRDGTPVVGVARSTPDIHITETLDLIADHFERFGGHAGAGGFALKPSTDLETFAQALERLTPVTRGMPNASREQDTAIDMTLSELTHEFLSHLSRCEPYGPGNPLPRIRLRGCILERIQALGVRHQWFRMTLLQGNDRVRARIPARSLRTDLEEGALFDIMCEARLREWHGVMQRDLTIQSITYHNPVQIPLIPVTM